MFNVHSFLNDCKILVIKILYPDQRIRMMLSNKNFHKCFMTFVTYKGIINANILMIKRNGME